jgi:hypothetical protein
MENFVLEIVTLGKPIAAHRILRWSPSRITIALGLFEPCSTATKCSHLKFIQCLLMLHRTHSQLKAE